MLISSSIPNLVNGVSQQPFTLRLASQAEVQENGLSTVAQGLKKRPPTKHIKKIINSAITNAYVHTINRDEAEKYTLVLTNEGLKVFDLDGNEQTVTFPQGTGYLTSTDPKNDFKVITINDYTFVVNKSFNVAESEAKYTPAQYEAIVNVKQGNYGKTYSVTIGGITGTFTTPNGGTASDVTQIATTHIAEQLRASLAQAATSVVNATISTATWSFSSRTGVIYTNSFYGDGWYTTFAETVYYRDYSGVTVTLAPGYDIGTLKFYVNGTLAPYYTTGVANQFFVVYRATLSSSSNSFTNPSVSATFNNSSAFGVDRYGSTLYITRKTDFTLSTSDGFNGNAMIAIKGTAKRYSDLPGNAPNGFVCEIAGDPTVEGDNYYVRFDTSESTATSDYFSGQWVETCKPGTSSGLSLATMPHVLVRNADGSFVFKQSDWTERKVGDKDTNPDPSFINQRIRDIVFFRNRLCLLSAESVAMSEAGEYFNFYRTTVTQLLDSDPIDVTASHTKVSILNHAVPFRSELLLLSTQSQFILSGADLLTPKTVSIKPVSEYENSEFCRPALINSNVYFPYTRSGYTGVKEFFKDPSSEQYEASDITGHIPTYIPSEVTKIAQCRTEDLLACLTSGKQNEIYVYKFFWDGTEKLQSSWSKWTFPSTDTILNVDFILSDMYITVSRSSGVFLEKMAVSAGDFTSYEPYVIHLDRKYKLDKTLLTYDGTYSKVLTSSLPYVPNDGEYVGVVANAQAKKAGTLAVGEIDGSYLKFQGDFTGSDLVFGRKYNFKYQFSPITWKQQKGNATSSDTQGRLQLRQMKFNFADTGFFEVATTPIGRNTYTHTYTGKTMGGSSATLGAFSISDGQFKVQTLGQNTTTVIELSNPTPLPCSFLSVDWEGFYTRRSGRSV